MENLKKVILNQIDYFHWEELDSQTYKLLYYDNKGERNERTISKTLLDKALKIFDGKTHLIKRTSGAYSLATPSQLLIYHNPNLAPSAPLSLESLKVNAKFIDLDRDKNGAITNNKLVVYFKNVHPSMFRTMEDKQDPFKNQYWLDLGHQIIPITVFDFFRDDKEMIKALFVKTEALKLISNQTKGQKEALTIYAAPEAVLRVSLPEESQAVIEQHTMTRSLTKQNLKLEIPEFLRFGPPQLIPTGSPMDVLTHYLRVCHDPHSIAIKQSFLSVLEKPHSESNSCLMPFGVFERA